MVTHDSYSLTDRQFKKICRIVNQKSGIVLKDGKEPLVRARLMKRVRALRRRALKIDSIDGYIKYLEGDNGEYEVDLMIDAVTTNETSFFRESNHFDFMSESVVPRLSNSGIRLWSAACSSGEEPYTLAMVLREQIDDIDRKDARILATDISVSMLDTAKKGIYEKEKISGVPVQFLRKYFLKSRNSPVRYKVKDSLKRLVQVSFLNLVEPWPMKGPFDVIFCRNVMIYFDKNTREKLTNRFWSLLQPGGYLFVGHSEGLTGIKHKFIHVKPAVYRK